MSKKILSESGSTLFLVLGTVIIVSMLMIPLVSNLSNGLLQTRTDAMYEQASAKAESAIRITKRIIVEAVDEENIFNWGHAENMFNEFEGLGLLNNTSVDYIPNHEGFPAIKVVATSGQGNQARSRTIYLKVPSNLPTAPGSGSNEPGPTEGSTGTEFYHTSAVIINNPLYNDIFYVCGAPGDVEEPDENFYNNDIDQAVVKQQYQEDFSNFIDYYTGANFTTRYNVGATVINAMNTSITEPTHTIVAPNGSIAGIVGHTGHVSITEAWKSFNITSPDGSSNAIVANGSLTIPNYISGTTSVINGNVKLGGNLSINGIETLTINGDVFVRGNFAFTNSTTKLVINGNLYVGGNLNFSQYTSQFNVSGNVIVGGSMTFNLGRMDIGGSLLGVGSIDFTNTAELVKINGDIISRTNITFKSITNVQIGGTVAALNNVLFTNTIASVTIGGDLLASGNMSFESINTTFLVGGILGAYSNVAFNNNINAVESKLGGFYAGGIATFPGWFDEDEHDTICIDYQSPNSGGSGSGIKFGA